MAASQVGGTHGGVVVVIAVIAVVVVVVVVVGQGVVVESSSHSALNPALVTEPSLWNLIVMLLPQLVITSGTVSPQNFSLYDP